MSGASASSLQSPGGANTLMGAPPRPLLAPPIHSAPRGPAPKPATISSSVPNPTFVHATPTILHNSACINTQHQPSSATNANTNTNFANVNANGANVNVNANGTNAIGVNSNGANANGANTNIVTNNYGGTTASDITNGPGTTVSVINNSDMQDDPYAEDTGFQPRTPTGGMTRHHSWRGCSVADLPPLGPHSQEPNSQNVASTPSGVESSPSKPLPPSSPAPIPLCLKEPVPTQPTSPTPSSEPSSLAIALAGTPPSPAPTPPLRGSTDLSLHPPTQAAPTPILQRSVSSPLHPPTQQAPPLPQLNPTRAITPPLTHSSSSSWQRSNVPVSPSTSSQTTLASAPLSANTQSTPSQTTLSSTPPVSQSTPSQNIPPQNANTLGEAFLTFTDTIFQHLPVTASMFKSGRNKVNAPEIHVEFGYHFSTIPRVSAWITVQQSLNIVRLPASLIIPSNAEFVVTLPPDKFEEYQGMAINWIAYTLPTDNPVLVDCINHILTAGRVTPGLVKKIEDCIASLSVNAATIRGQTILHAACYSGHMELVNMILEKNPNLDAQDDRGWTPLMSCLDAQNYRIANTLLAKGCKTNLFNSRKNAAIHLLLRKSCNTPEKLSVLAALLASCDPNLHSGSGQTPLLLAVTEQANTEAVKLLLEAGADPNNNASQLSPLFLAVSFPGCLPILELLLSYGADPKLGPANSTFYDVASTSVEFAQLLDKWEKGLLPRRYAHPKLFASSSTVAQTLKNMTSGGYGKSKPTLEIIKALSAATSSSTEDVTFCPPVIERFEETLSLPDFHKLQDTIGKMLQGFIKAKYPVKEEGDAVYQLVNDIMNQVDSHPKRKTLAERKPLTEQVKRYVMEQLYTHLFNKKELKEKDAAFAAKISKLQPAVTSKHIEMRDGLDTDLIQSATKELLEIENAKTPQEKLLCILNCSKVLVTVLQKVGAVAGADDLFPLFVHVVLYANVPSWHSHLGYIERLSENSASASEAFYFYTTVTCVTVYIEDQLYLEVFP
ncbi:hypothetical protein Pelo_12725 [Pelomyxa schiedti]|nr:hypothetical protein Pelo_12725 [Pelomyxa schiedti]